MLARFIFSHQPSWAATLLRLRDVLVAGFGLKTSRQLAAVAAAADKSERVGIFRVYSTNETGIVMGEDDKHLDFRLSVLCSTGAAPDSGRQLTMSTVVHCHNLLGRVYIMVIAQFHRMVVKASLRRAAKVGWPGAAADT